MQQIGGGSAEEESKMIYQSEHLLFFLTSSQPAWSQFLFTKTENDNTVTNYSASCQFKTYFLSFADKKRDVREDVHVAFFHMITVNSGQASCDKKAP